MRFVEESSRLSARDVATGSGLRPNGTAIIGGQSAEILQDSWGRWFWLCPCCQRQRQHLYVIDGAIECRTCASLDYSIRHPPLRDLPAAAKVSRLRRKAGADPSLGAPIPRRERGRERYHRLVKAIYRAEAELVACLRAHNDRLERNLQRQNAARAAAAAEKT